jgi:hypothetical protein
VVGTENIRVESRLFKRGATIACLREEGKTPVVKDILHRLQMIGVKEADKRLISQVGIGSREQDFIGVEAKIEIKSVIVTELNAERFKVAERCCMMGGEAEEVATRIPAILFRTYVAKSAAVKLFGVDY